MEANKVEFVDPEAVSEALKCSICFDVLKDPVAGGCQHVFCNACILPAIRLNARCPVCRKKMGKASLQPALFARTMLDELRVHCSMRCGWTGKRQALHGHLAACPVKLLRDRAEGTVATERALKETRAVLSKTAAKLDALTREQGVRRQETRLLEAELLEARCELYQTRRELAVALAERDQAVAERDEVRAQFASVEAEPLSRVVSELERITASLGSCKDGLRAQSGVIEQMKAERGLKRVHEPRQCPDLPCQIFVKTDMSRTLVLAVKLNWLVSFLMDLLRRENGVPTKSFYLAHQGRRLDESQHLWDAGVTAGATLWMRLLPHSQQGGAREHQ